jgi:hypothetical protein
MENTLHRLVADSRRDCNRPSLASSWAFEERRQAVDILAASQEHKHSASELDSRSLCIEEVDTADTDYSNFD